MWFNSSKSSLQALPIFSSVMSISQQIHTYPHKFPSIFRGWEGSDTLISNDERLWMVARRPSTTKWKVIIQTNIWYHLLLYQSCLLVTQYGAVIPHHVTPDVMWKHTICRNWNFFSHFWQSCCCCVILCTTYWHTYTLINTCIKNKCTQDNDTSNLSHFFAWCKFCQNIWNDIYINLNR